jgi:hypothetical protein
LIPTRVAVKFPEVKGKEKGEGGALFGGFVVFIILLFAVPFYMGGGSLGAAAIPGLVEIAPDSVDLAIKNNPEWPLATRLTLRGLVTVVQSTPTVALDTLFGIQQNSLQSLWFVPLYWVEKLANRDWQVKTAAEIITKNVNNPNNKLKPSSD